MSETAKKVVIVTGGGKGIGAEYSAALGNKGYQVVVADIDQEGAG